MSRPARENHLRRRRVGSPHPVGRCPRQFPVVVPGRLPRASACAGQLTAATTIPGSQARPLTTDASLPDGTRRSLVFPLSASARASLSVPCICLCLSAGGTRVASDAFLPSSANHAVSGSPWGAWPDAQSSAGCGRSGSPPAPRSSRYPTRSLHTPLRPWTCLRATASPDLSKLPCLS